MKPAKHIEDVPNLSSLNPIFQSAAHIYRAESRSVLKRFLERQGVQGCRHLLQSAGIAGDLSDGLAERVLLAGGVGAGQLIQDFADGERQGACVAEDQVAHVAYVVVLFGLAAAHAADFHEVHEI